MGDIGGTLGLFIGLSVCTALEFFEYVLDVTILILTMLYKRKSKNKVNEVTRLPPNYDHQDITWEHNTGM